MIESLQNNTIKQALKLKQKKYRHLNNQFLIEGIHLIEEAINDGCVFKIFVRQDTLLKFDFDHVEVVSHKVMDALCDTQSNSDCVAVCAMKQNEFHVCNTCIAYQVQDPGNLGTIIRSAVSFGFNQCIFVDCVDVYNDKVIRSSQGAIFSESILQSNSIDEVLALCRNKGLQIVATSLHNATALKEATFKRPVAIVMGNEGQGLPVSVVNQCDQSIKIEMENFESLNVAVAASIMMYTINQQK